MAEHLQVVLESLNLASLAKVLQMVHSFDSPQWFQWRVLSTRSPDLPPLKLRAKEIHLILTGLFEHIGPYIFR